MCWNCASRSGWEFPSSVFRFAWKTVALLVQQVSHLARTHPMPLPRELLCELAQALARPAQSRLRVPSARRVHQRLEVLQQRRIVLGEALPSPSGTPLPPLGSLRFRPVRQLCQAARNRPASCLGRSRNRRNASAAQHLSYACPNQAPVALSQHRSQLREQLRQPLVRDRLHGPYYRTKAPCIAPLSSS